MNYLFEKSDPLATLRSVREVIADNLLVAISIVAVPPLFSSLYRYADMGWNNVFYFHILLYLLICVAAIFRRKLFFVHKALILITAGFLTGCSTTITMGLVGNGTVYLLFSIILATMFFGVRHGVIIIMAGLVLLISVTLGIDHGWIIFDFNMETAALARSAWTVKILTFTFFTVILIFSLGGLIDYLATSGNIFKRQSLELKLSNEKVLEEIAEKKKVEYELRKSEEKYRLLIENIPSVAWIRNENGETIFISPNVEKVYGFSQEEIYESGQSLWYGKIHPDDVTEVRKSFESLLYNGINFDKEYRIQKKDGEWIWIYDTAFLTYKEDDIRYAYGIFSDITERKNAEEEKLILESQLRQAQQMEAIGTLAGGIAHDFNNILSPIISYSELAMMALPEDNSVQQYLHSILKAGERARELVKQILTFARKREKEKIPIKTSLIVKEATKFLRSTIPSTIELKYSCNTKHDNILADPTQVNQIVMNLCTNAAHAMREEGGTLEVILDVEHLKIDDISKFDHLTPGEYLRITVKDTGSGITPDIMKKIFDPYFTTKGLGEGTGLGLAVVHGIVKDCCGKIYVESEVGNGTRFDVMLPLIEVEEIPLISKDKSVCPGGKEHILLVDDEKEIVDITRAILENLGYRVTSMGSSSKALETFRNNPEKYDLVITDMTMPNITGRELVKRLIDIRPDIPVILCTGFSYQIDERIAKKIGACAFVMKPVAMNDLARIVRDILDKRQ